MLRNIFVRVWAELGRTHISARHARSSSRSGAVVELDQDAQAPVELFANGLCFASGKPRGHGRGRVGRAQRATASSRPADRANTVVLKTQDRRPGVDNRGRLFLGVDPSMMKLTPLSRAAATSGRGALAYACSPLARAPPSAAGKSTEPHGAAVNTRR